MAEILLSIQQEDVPPIARGIIAVDFLNDPEIATKQIRSVIYPGWERLENRDPLPEELQPYFRVLCDTPRQAMLADMLKPSNAKVDIILPKEPKPEPVAVKETHPFIQKLRSRTGTLLNVVSLAYGTVMLLGAQTQIASQNIDKADFLTIMGAGLVLTGTALTAIRSGYMPIIEITPIKKNREATN